MRYPTDPTERYITRPNRDEDDDRERPDWREIDRRKDRSHHSAQNDSLNFTKKKGRKAREEAREQREAMNQLEGLFTKGSEQGMPKDQLKMLEALRGVSSKDSFASELKRYSKKFGFPGDWTTLLVVLDFGSKEDQLQAFAQIEAILEGQSEASKDALRSKLNILASTSFDPDILDAVENLIAQFDA